MPEVRFSLEIPETFSTECDEVLQHWADSIEEFQLRTPTFPSDDLLLELEPPLEDSIPWGMIWRQEWSLAITIIRNATLAENSPKNWQLLLNIPLLDDSQTDYYVRTRLIDSLTAPFWLPKDPMWSNEERLTWQNILSAAWLNEYEPAVYSRVTI